jgi:hypothetical protein
VDLKKCEGILNCSLEHAPLRRMFKTGISPLRPLPRNGCAFVFEKQRPGLDIDMRADTANMNGIIALTASMAAPTFALLSAVIPSATFFGHPGAGVQIDL